MLDGGACWSSVSTRHTSSVPCIWPGGCTGKSTRTVPGLSSTEPTVRPARLLHDKWSSCSDPLPSAPPGARLRIPSGTLLSACLGAPAHAPRHAWPRAWLCAPLGALLSAWIGTSLGALLHAWHGAPSRHASRCFSGNLSQTTTNPALPQQSQAFKLEKCQVVTTAYPRKCAWGALGYQLCVRQEQSLHCHESRKAVSLHHPRCQDQIG